MTLPEVTMQFSTETRCRELLERLRWPEGVMCPVLHVTFADPAGLRQAAAELGVLGFPAGQVRLWLRLHERKSSSLVNKAVYIPLYAHYHTLLPRLASPTRPHGRPRRPTPPPLPRLHPLPTRRALWRLLAPNALPQGHRPRQQPGSPLH